ncbi:MAG: hypothetical protein WCW35_14005 [Bacteroidota bacterium]
MKPTNVFLLLLLSAMLPHSILSQVISHTPSEFRGDVNYRRSSNIDGNNIRTSIFNSGYAGNPGNRPDYVNFEWPKNTGRIYIALVDIFLGGEVIGNDGETTYLVEVPTGRSDPSGNSWNLEPVPGFIDPEQTEIARSDKPSTWPKAVQGGWRDKKTDFWDPGWSGSWNGFFGKNIFNADQEAYYVTSDDLYKRQPYTPDTTDFSRGGLGLIMDVRTLAWSHVLVNDILFSIHDIKNDGTKTIEKASFLMFVADWVGGDNPDDFPFVDLQTATAFLTDVSRTGSEAFGGSPVGVASLKYIETPGNQVNGIDDDGDAIQFPNLLAAVGNDTAKIPQFTENEFAARVLQPGDKIVLIEPETYNRIVTTYPAGGGIVRSLNKEYSLPANGATLREDTIANGYDEDLDGIIDEKRSLHLLHINEVTQTVIPVRYINYTSYAAGDTIKRGFVVSGMTAAWNHRNIAPMIDESRDDGFDNDNDWDSFLDDYGMDGVRATGDAGEGDGKPTSGAGTEFPGETNVDKTDVSETDLIGITSAFQINDGIVNRNSWSDKSLWDLLMIPGKVSLVRQEGEFQTYVASGFFPLLPGQRQRMAISVSIAAGGTSSNADIESVVRKQAEATKAYNADYQFAQAPLQVTITAVPGDGQVTLYWDDIAENSFDRYINKIGGNGKDFEGYKIYRATDAAFLDAKVITDAYGVKTLLNPIAQFDLKDGIDSLHSIDINGVKFYLGAETGIRHQYTDRDVINGQRYFYAVTAYDFGFEAGRFAPSETPIQVNVTTDGSITHGKNVAVVRPSAAAAGYKPPQIESFTHVTGGATGTIGIEIIDPKRLKNGHQYDVTFRDSVFVVSSKNVVKTISFSLRDNTENVFLLKDDPRINPGDEISIVDGFRLQLTNEQQLSLNAEKSIWNSTSVYAFDFNPFSSGFIQGTQHPYDYRIIVGNTSLATSKDTTIGGRKYTGKPVNFKVVNTTLNIELEFLFSENHGTDGSLSINPSLITPDADRISFLEIDQSGKKVLTWQFVLNLKSGTRNPQEGDTVNIILNKPFLSFDQYQFTIKQSSIAAEKGRADLSRIRVVPNPYVAAEIWEPRNTFTSGRGPREIHFINLPAQCTIRIFNVAGALVRKIEHESAREDGTAIWDVLSDEKFEIAYGIYVYHIDAPGIGAKTGTFAIIK